MKKEALRSVFNYGKRGSPSSGSPRTAASLARLRQRAYRKVGLSKFHNEATFKKNTARVMKMMKEIANYEARRRHKLVRQPSGSFALARRN